MGAVTFATLPRKPEGEMLWRYALVAGKPGEGWTPQAVFERHALKGDRSAASAGACSAIWICIIRPARNSSPIRRSMRWRF